MVLDWNRVSCLSYLTYKITKNHKLIRVVRGAAMNKFECGTSMVSFKVVKVIDARCFRQNDLLFTRVLQPYVVSRLSILNKLKGNANSLAN